MEQPRSAVADAVYAEMVNRHGLRKLGVAVKRWCKKGEMDVVSHRAECSGEGFDDAFGSAATQVRNE